MSGVFGRTRACIVAGLLLALVPLRFTAAQDSTSADLPSATSWSPVYSVQLGGPQRASIAAGVGQWTSSGIDALSGRYLLFDGGIGGGKVVFGVADGYNGGLSQARLTLVRTWRDPAYFTANRTLAALELHHSLGILTVGVAHYWRVTGNRGERARAVIWTVGALF